MSERQIDHALHWQRAAQYGLVRLLTNLHIFGTAACPFLRGFHTFW